MTVAVIGRAGMGETQRLVTELRDRGAEPQLVDLSEWPGDATARVRPDSDELVLDVDISLEQVESVYAHVAAMFRSTDICVRSEFDDTSETYPALLQLQEHRALFESVCRTFESKGIPVVPGERNHYLQERKPWQLRQFEQHDLPVPETVFTNDPETVRTFCAGRDRVVYKPVSRGADPNIIDAGDLDPDRLANLSTAPVQFQTFVPGEDLRIYVLGGEVIGAVRYDSDSFSFKAGPEEAVNMVPASVTADIEETAVRAAAATGVTFGGVDIRRKPSGGHALLEVNQTPAFAYADTEAGQSVGGALAEYLLTVEHT